MVVVPASSSTMPFESEESIQPSGIYAAAYRLTATKPYSAIGQAQQPGDFAMPTIPETLAIAIRHHQGGRLLPRKHHDSPIRRVAAAVALGQTTKHNACFTI